MIPELGHMALCIATALALLQLSTPMLARAGIASWLGQSTSAISTVILMLVTMAFAALMHAYAISDFTVLNVIENSHSLKPMLYKITGTWGNHEGSMLLWLWVLSFFTFLVAITRHQNTALHATTQQILGALLFGLLLFILFTSNPFVRVFPPATDGQGLNPLLQDIGLAFHPPTLYLGYVGFGVVFAYAIAGMLRGAINADWARAAHPWILGSWATLTAGIGLGSWWAYRELGWGGWWFWDPVENVALLPWLVGGALMHANLVLAMRGSFARWVALLAIMSFSMSLIGTFIVRSGLITSVHAFASDPERGVFILAYIALATGAGLAVFAAWNNASASPRKEALISRAGLIAMNNVLLVTAALSILLAILYPLFLTMAGLPSISVGPPYFNAVIIPICAPLLLLAAAAPLMPWEGAWQQHVRHVVLYALPITLVIGMAVFLLIDSARIPTFIGLSLSAITLLGVAHYVLKLRRAIPKGGTLAQVPLRRIGSAIGHVGLAIFAIGLVASSLFKTTLESPMQVGDTLKADGYEMSLTALNTSARENYFARTGNVEIMENGNVIAELQPETRLYPVRDQETTESALNSNLWRDIVAVIGRANYRRSGDDNTTHVGVRIYIIPGQQAVWLGFILATLGSLLATFSVSRRS